MADIPLRENPAVNAFVNMAQRYCALLEGTVRDRDLWLADVLNALSTLYAAAPMACEAALPEDGLDIPAQFHMSNDQWNALYLHLRRQLGKDAEYCAYFNPAAKPAMGQEPTSGDLADDLADIYRDLRPGLTAWNGGDDRYLEDILYQWVHLRYVHHWGRHAVDAMRALHWLVYK